MRTFASLRRKVEAPVKQAYVRTPEELDLVRRLDVFLMTFGCISQGAWKAFDPEFILTYVSHQIP